MERSEISPSCGGGGGGGGTIGPCSIDQHCYAIANYSSVDKTGAIANIKADVVSGTSSYFSTSELWVIDQGLCGGWTEEGIHSGHRKFVSSYGLAWFWAEAYYCGYTWPGCGIHGNDYYDEWYGGTDFGAIGFSYGQRYPSRIEYYTGSKWRVYVHVPGEANARLIGTTRACHLDRSDLLQVGAETQYYPNVSANANGLQKRNTSGSWSYDWTGAIPTRSEASPANPFAIDWDSPDQTYKWVSWLTS